MDFINIKKKQYVLFFPNMFPEDCKTLPSSEDPVDVQYLGSNQSDPLPDPEDDEDDDGNESVLGSRPRAWYDTETIIESGHQTKPTGTLSVADMLNYTYTKPTQTIEQFDTLPRQFVDPKIWPQKVNLCCCFCSAKIPKAPHPIGLSSTNMSAVDIVQSYGLNISEDEGEVRVYNVHEIAGCDIVHAVNYIRKVSDKKIPDKSQAVTLTFQIHKMLTGMEIFEVVDVELWTSMRQYKGNSGYTCEEWQNKYSGREFSFKRV